MSNHFFHISFRDDLEGIWRPMTPAGSDIGKKTKLSEPDIPRISVAPSIEDCFRAIYPNVSKYFETEKYPWMEFFVYSPLYMEKKRTLNWEDLIEKNYVHDAHVTKESWILDPVKMILVMKVKIMNTERKNNELLYRPFNDKNQELRYHSPKEIDVKILKKYQNISTNNKYDIMSYQEQHDSTFSSNGKEYRLNVIFEMTKNQKPMEMDIDLFTWILPYTTVQESRVTTADLKAPILVFFDPDDKRWIVIDGAHRLTKAVRQKEKTILCKIVNQTMLDKALIKNKEIKNKPLFLKW